MTLNACTVGPDFHKPTVLSLASFIDQKNILFKSLNLQLGESVSLRWWQVFKLPLLNEIVEQGLHHNYSIIAMQERLAQAQELVNAASGQLWPQASFTTAVGRQKYGVALFGPLPIKIPPFTYYELGPTATYNPDLFGGIKRNLEKQQALAFYQQYQLFATYLNITNSIVSTVLQIAIINTQIQATKQIIADDRLNYNLVKLSFKLGAISQTQVLSIQSQLTNDETLLPPLYQRLTTLHNTLSILLGLPPGAFTNLAIKLNSFTLPRQLPLSFPTELLHKRPDILAAEARLHAASAQIGIATARLFPNLILSATTLQEALTPAKLLNASSNAWSLLANLTNPIFTGGTLRAQRRAAIHAFKSACANYQQVVLQAFAEVSNLLYALKHDQQEITLQRNAIATAKASLRLARLSFNAGNAGTLEILSAQRIYDQAYLGLINAQGQQLQNTVQLYIAMGGGFDKPTCIDKLT